MKGYCKHARLYSPKKIKNERNQIRKNKIVKKKEKILNE
jgi:hypothetical protein